MTPNPAGKEVIITDREFYITELNAILRRLSDCAVLEKEKRILDEQLSIDAKAVNDLIAQNARVAQNQTEYKEREAALVERYKQTEAKRNEVIEQISRLQVHRRIVERFIRSVEELPELFTEVDVGLWAALVDSLTVYSKERITWHLTCGMEVEC